MRKKQETNVELEKLQEKEKKSIKCNICDYPKVISYTETDLDSGQQVTKQHLVKCLGHPGIHYSIWNLHEYHDRYKKSLLLFKNKLGQLDRETTKE